MAEKFLVTGALGCIGAWTVKRLVAEGVPVWTYDLPGEPHRLRLIMDDAALAKVNFIHGDITDAAALSRPLRPMASPMSCIWPRCRSPLCGPIRWPGRG